MGIVWSAVGSLMFLSFIGKSYAPSCFKISAYLFLPTGKEIIEMSIPSGNELLSANCWRSVINRFWFVIAGWWLFCGHLIFAALNIITLFGISSGRVHLILACTALNPIESRIVCTGEAAEVKRQDAQRRVQKIKNELFISNR